MIEDPDSDDALLWRRAAWDSLEAFQTGQLPNRGITQVIGDISALVNCVPEQWHWWLVDRTREHAIAVEDGARLLAMEDSNPDRELETLFEHALAAMAATEKVQSSVLSAGRGESDQLRAETIGLLCLLREAGNGPRSVAESQLADLDRRVVQLVRDHAYVTSSFSWRVTEPLRRLRRLYLKVVRRAARITPAGHPARLH